MTTVVNRGSLTRLAQGGSLSRVDTFGPERLFINGEQGAWYDPSDFDRYMSQLGANVVVNGDASGGTSNWTATNATFSISGGGLSVAATANFGFIEQTFAITGQRSWELRFDILSSPGGAQGVINIYDTALTVNSTISPLRFGVGSHRVIVTQNGLSLLQLRVQASGNTVVFDNVSIRELTAISTATLFQDSAGTTPVTAVEQPVGLMLDKSRGLVLGTNVVVNGDFSNGTNNWTANGVGASVSGGVLTLTGGTGFFSQSFATVVGRTYRVTGNILQVGTVFTAIRKSDDASATLNAVTISSAVGAAQGVFTATAATTFVVLQQNSSATAGQFSNISVRELPGNHASQSTTTARPVLSALVNRLTATDLLDTNWTGSNAARTTVASSAPISIASASRISVSNTSVNEKVWYLNSPPTVVATAHTASIFAKAEAMSWIYLRCDNGTATGVYFDVANGVVGTADGGAVGTIQPLTGGWFRCTVTRTLSAGQGYGAVQLASGNGVKSFAGTAGEGVLVCGADLRVANESSLLPAYQRVTTSTDYDTAGFPVYLRFDVDDVLRTPGNVNFTATDKMFLATGYTLSAPDLYANIVNLGDALQGSAPGGFWLHNTQLNELVITVQGTGVPSNYAGYNSGVGVAVPSNKPQVFAANMSTTGAGYANIIPYVKNSPDNFTWAATGGGIPGSGTFGNLPLFIGRTWTRTMRGRFYGTVVRGAATNAADISATERWLASRTGVSL